jgi:hypothetical protein
MTIPAIDPDLGHHVSQIVATYVAEPVIQRIPARRHGTRRPRTTQET